MTNVYKINLFSFYVHDKDHLNGKKEEIDRREEYKTHCTSHKILGWGWHRKNAREVKTLDEYKADYGKSRSLTIACNQIRDMKAGDFCWTYVSREWYLGKVEGDFKFNTPDSNYPEFGMYRTCKWLKISDSDLVPGVICAHSKKEATVLHVSSDTAFISYCEYLYKNRVSTEKIKGFNFWTLAHTDDLEDLVGIYLQTIGYYVFPSTNKQGTKDYEFKLIHKDTHKEALIQCKNNADIPLDNLEKTYSNEEIYILGIKDNNRPKYTEFWEMGWQSKDGRIKIFDAQKIEKWARDNKSILPKRIQNFLQLSQPSD